MCPWTEIEAEIEIGSGGSDQGPAPERGVDPRVATESEDESDRGVKTATARRAETESGGENEIAPRVEIVIARKRGVIGVRRGVDQRTRRADIDPIARTGIQGALAAVEMRRIGVEKPSKPKKKKPEKSKRLKISLMRRKLVRRSVRLNR